MSAPRRYTLTLSCPDRVGIVAAVSQFVAAHGGWITEANHHADSEEKRFFMRQDILAESLDFDLAVLREKFAPIAAQFHMKWKINDSARKKRVVILVSKQEHCLYDLLARWQSKELDIDIPCVISNHDTFKGFVEWHGIPFHHDRHLCGGLLRRPVGAPGGWGQDHQNALQGGGGGGRGL